MALYNLTNLENAESLQQIALFANEVTGQKFFLLVMIAVFIILLFQFKKYDLQSAILGSSFISFLASGMLWFAKLVSVEVPIAFLAILAFSLLYSMMQR